MKMHNMDRVVCWTGRSGNGPASLLAVLLLNTALAFVGAGNSEEQISLSANGVAQNGTQYEAYFSFPLLLRFSPIKSYLPVCSVNVNINDTVSIQLVNIDNGFVAASHEGPVSNSSTLQWYASSPDQYDLNLSGRYVCRLIGSSGTHTSLDSYMLNVVRPPKSLQCDDYESDFIYMNTRTTIECFLGGYRNAPYAMVSVTGLNNLTITYSGYQPFFGQLGFRLFFLGRDTVPATGMFLTGSITVQLPPFNCTGARNSSLFARCQAIQATVLHKNFTYMSVAHCNNFTSVSLSPSSPPFFDYDTTYNVNCSQGFQQISPPYISRVSCQVNGSWTALPNCTDIDECVLSPCKDNSSTCVNTVGGYRCQCPAGTTGNGRVQSGCIALTTAIPTQSSPTTQSATAIPLTSTSPSAQIKTSIATSAATVTSASGTVASCPPAMYSAGVVAGSGIGGIVVGAVAAFLVTYFFVARRQQTGTGSRRRGQEYKVLSDYSINEHADGQ